MILWQNGWIWTPLMPENIYAKSTNRSFLCLQVTYLSSTDWLEEKISSYLKLDKNRSSTISTLNASLPQVIAANLIDRIWDWFWWNLLNPARTVGSLGVAAWKEENVRDICIYVPISRVNIIFHFWDWKNPHQTLIYFYSVLYQYLITGLLAKMWDCTELIG